MRKFTRRTILAGLAVSPAALTLPQTGRAEESNVDLKGLIAAARPGDTIVVPEGDHRYDQLTVDKPLTLRGARNDRWATRIHAKFVVQAADVRLENLSFIGSLSPTLADKRGYNPREQLVVARNADRLIISNCVMRYSRGTGLQLAASEGVLLENCLLTENAGTGINMAQCTRARIRSNTLDKNVWFGIEARSVKECRFEGNHIRASGWTAIWLHNDSADNVIVDNVIEGSDAGVTVASSNNLVTRNRFRNNAVAVYLGRGPFGRAIKETGGKSDEDCSIGGVTVSDNSIVAGKQVAILVRQGTRHTIRRNSIFDMQRSGIVVQSESEENVIADNNVARCGLWGILIGQSANNVVRNNRVRECRAALRLVESANTRVSNLVPEQVEAAVLADGASQPTTRVPADTDIVLDRATGRRAVRLRDGEPHRWSVKGEDYSVLFGDFHVHTENSDGTGTLETAYAYGGDALGLDFMAASDHSDLALLLLGPKWWKDQVRTADRLGKPGSFSAFSGMEVTYAAGVHGHWNVYFAEDEGRTYPVFSFEETPGMQALREEKGRRAVFDIARMVKREPNPEAATPELLMNTVAKHGGDAFVIIHHYWRTPGFWEKSPRGRGYLLATEICSRHGIWETPAGPSRVDVAPEQTSTLEDGLRNGWKLAVIGGSDSHYGTAATRALAGVYAKENTREAIREALRARRTFATTGARIIVEFTSDGYPMGADYAADGAPELIARILTRGGFAGRLLLIRGDDIISQTSGRGNLTLKYRDGSFRTGSYYRIRYIRQDGEQAWSSPIWIS